MRFVDTNVLLYAISTDPEERQKALQARELLKQRDLCLSVQVLQEFYVQATRTSRRDRVDPEVAAGFVEAFARFPVADIGFLVLRRSIETSRRFRISYWDAAILEAARAQGCEIVLSEDLDHQTDYEGIRIVNPFRAAVESGSETE